MRLLFFLLISMVFWSCDPVRGDSYASQAYMPVYLQPSTLQAISLKPVQPTEKAGKIYAYGPYIFQNEVNKGIHIIDNSDKAHPKKVGFLNISYNIEMAIRGQYLYANYLNDLVVLDLQNPQQPQLVKRIPNAFPAISQRYPPYNNVYFVCPDPAKGIVVDWQLQTVDKQPNCRR